VVVVTKVIIATWVHQVPHNTNVAMRNTSVPWVRDPRVPVPRKNEHCGCIPVPEGWNVTPMLPFTVNALPIRLKVHIRVIPTATIDLIPMLICPLGGWRRLVCSFVYSKSTGLPRCSSTASGELARNSCTNSCTTVLFSFFARQRDGFYYSSSREGVGVGNIQ
jgi:hypothetical protein